MFSHRLTRRSPATPWERLALALALGAAMPFAFSPYDYKWLAILALAGWVALLNREHAFKTSFMFGFGWFGFGAWWLVETFHTYGPVSWPLALFAVVLLGAFLALLPAIWGWLAVKCAGDGVGLMVMFPVLAVAIEWLRGHLLTGLPWTTLGNLAVDTHAVGWAAEVGVYGLALLPALLAVSLVFLLHPMHRREGAAGLLLALACFWLAPQPYMAEGKEQRAALIQGNIPQDKKWDAAFLKATMFRYAQLSAKAAPQADVIVWPEAAVPFFLSEAPGWDAWLSEQARGWETPLLFGGLQLQSGRVAQNGLFLYVNGREQGFVGKQHLVPFGEYVPEWIPFVHMLAPNIADFRPAQGGAMLKNNGITFGALICYEAIFPEEARARVEEGAQVLVNVTNDAWYDTSPASWQHLQSVRMRAVETGRFVLRAANTGVSAIIAPDGHITASIPWWTQGAVLGVFRSSDVITPYQRQGDMLLLFLLLPAILVTYWYHFRRRL